MKLVFEVELAENKLDLFWDILDSLDFVKKVRQTNTEELPTELTMLLDKRIQEYEKQPEKVIKWENTLKKIEQKKANFLK